MPATTSIIGWHVRQQANGSFRATVEFGTAPGVVCASAEITRPTPEAAQAFISWHIRNECTTHTMAVDDNPFDGSMSDAQ